MREEVDMSTCLTAWLHVQANRSVFKREVSFVCGIERSATVEISSRRTDG